MPDKNTQEGDDSLDEFDRALKDFFEDSVDGEAAGDDNQPAKNPLEPAAVLDEAVDRKLEGFFGDGAAGAAEGKVPPSDGMPETEKEPPPTVAVDAPAADPPDSTVTSVETDAIDAETAREDKSADSASAPQEKVTSPARPVVGAPAEEPVPAFETAGPITSGDNDRQRNDASVQEHIHRPPEDPHAPAPTQPEKRKGRRRIALLGAAAVIAVSLAVALTPNTPDDKAGVPTDTERISPRPSPTDNRPQSAQETPPPPASSPASTVQETPPPPATSPASTVQAAPPPPIPAKPVPAPPAAAAVPAVPPVATVEAYPSGAYPYAIHLSSFKSPEGAEKEATTERDRGLRVYPVHVDLGKKGIWYRLYYGYFKSAGAATAAITEDRLTNVMVRSTRYACLVGSYSSAAESEATSRRLTEKGFFPYTIDIGAAHHVFVGAYHTLKAAKARSQALSDNGFANDIINR